VTGTGAVRGAELWYDNLAQAGELLIELAFWLAIPSIRCPGQDPHVRTQGIEVPVSGCRAVQMPVQTRFQAAFGTTGVGVVTPGEYLASQAANNQLTGRWQPQEHGIGPPRR